jgi:trimeric autotransporter adhesin
VNPAFEKISNVAFADINNPSTSPEGYEDFTSVVGNVTQGSSQDITVTISNGFADDQVLVWIDFDQSESFEPGELVYTSPLGVGPHTGTITIPLNASLGQTRMRIRLHDSVLGGNPAPCGTSTYGQVEDYTINVDISTGVSEAGSLQLGVFPNPSNGDLFVRHNIDGAAQLDVMDITGHLVYSTQRSLVSGEVAQLPLAGKLAAGTYILRVTSGNIRGEQRVVVY